jgi:cytoskeletal protein CcmA (bactofilin family)
VIVAGHVDGDIVADEKVEITESARITGTVTALAIAVAEGAIVEGVMKTTGKTEPVEFVEKRKDD